MRSTSSPSTAFPSQYPPSPYPPSQCPYPATSSLAFLSSFYLAPPSLACFFLHNIPSSAMSIPVTTRSPEFVSLLSNLFRLSHVPVSHPPLSYPPQCSPHFQLCYLHLFSLLFVPPSRRALLVRSHSCTSRASLPEIVLIRIELNCSVVFCCIAVVTIPSRFLPGSTEAE